MPLERDHIYLIPPGKDLELVGNELHVIERDARDVLHLPIDRFFSSLASSVGSRAVALILSGTGRDGSRGIIDVHRRGGLICVQSPKSATFDGMPAAAIGTRTADFIGTPEEIAHVLGDSPMSEKRLAALSRRRERTIPADAGDMSAVFEALVDQFDLDFSEYKSSTVVRRLQRRLTARDCRSIEQYVALLRRDPAELDALWGDMLIGVTRFFRDEEAFGLLKTDVLPQILSAHPLDEEIRVWVPACASGEEAYSLAILLDEVIASRGHSRRFRVFATDVHPGALATASRGVFSEAAVQSLSASRLSRYFEQTGDSYTVIASLRRRIVFAAHNLLADPPFTRIDLVSCRNMMIYLLPEAQVKVIQRMTFALREDGVLFLGPSESLGSQEPAFTPINRKWRVFRRRRDHQEALTPSELRTPRTRPRPPMLSPLPRPTQRFDRDFAISQILERYVPAGFLIDAQRVMLHVFGDCERYLRVRGPVSLDLVSLLEGDLQLAVTAAIHRAMKEGGPVQLTARREQGSEVVQIDVERLTPGGPDALLFVGISPSTTRRSEAAPEQISDLVAHRIADLEFELVQTRASLQTAIEQLETSNEELQATNEELLASNEELQATNEELQSVNEELHTVNAEYERSNNSLSALNDDLLLLIECTDIGMVFLDERLRVRRYTPAIEDVFRFREHDIGRPLSEIAHHLSDDSGAAVLRIARAVMETGQLHEREVSTSSGQPLLERQHPHCSSQGEVLGVALSYVDLSRIRETETALRSAQALNQAIINALAANVAVIDEAGTIIAVNESWTVFAEDNGGDAEVLGTGANYLLASQMATASDASGFAQAAFDGIRDVLRGRVAQFEQVYPCHAPDQERWFLMRVTRLHGDPVHKGVVISHIDVSEMERLRLETMIAASRLELLGAAVVAATDAIFVSDRAGNIEYANPAFEAMMGWPDRPRDPAEVQRFFQPAPSPEPSWAALLGGDRWAGELSILAEGEPILVTAAFSPITGKPGGVEHIVGVQRDISAQHALEQELLQRQKLESIGTLAGGIAHDFNNILGAILGYAELLAHSLADNPQATDDVKQILKASLRARDLVQQILTFSRRSPIQIVRLKPATILTECLQLLREVIPNAVSLEQDISAQELWIEADATQLHQVMMNLMTNAYQAIGDGPGTIHVQLGAADDSTLLLSVRDDGAGMSEEVQARLFEPFYTTKSDGTGMGMSVVHGIVTRIGGKIEITSAPGAGTTIAIRLPLTESPLASRAGRSTPSPHGEELIYIVDDEPALARLMARTLRPLGYRVETFTSSVALYARVVEHQQPDLLIADYDMPQLTGAALVEKLRGRGASFPVVLVSGCADEAVGKPGDIALFSAVLYKPFQQQELARTVRRALDARPGLLV